MHKVIISEGFRKAGRREETQLAIKVTQVKLESKFNPERVIIHEFCGEYEFEKLNNPTLKSIKRDLIALKISQAQRVKVEFWKLDSDEWHLKLRDSLSLFDVNNAYKNLKNNIVAMQFNQ